MALWAQGKRVASEDGLCIHSAAKYVKALELLQKCRIFLLCWIMFEAVVKDSLILTLYTRLDDVMCEVIPLRRDTIGV